MTGSGFAIFCYFVVFCFLYDTLGGTGPVKIKLLLTTGVNENAVRPKQELVGNNREIWLNSLIFQEVDKT